MFVIKSIVLHVLPEENMSFTVYETLQEHVNRMLVWNHGVFYTVENGHGTFDLSNHLKVVKSFVQK